MKGSALVAVAVTALLQGAFATPLHPRQDRIYDFALLKPTSDLQWKPCFEEGFTCTVLQVPLDYTSPAAGTTGIAFIKWSAQNATNTSAVQDILVNPGGPGGSGTAFLRTAISALWEMLGTQNNIVSFDPRSVNNSGPSVSCFPGQDSTAALYDPEFRRGLDVNDTRTVEEAWARGGAFGEWCSHVHAGANSSAKYVNTPATATDMLRYTEVLAKSKGEDPSRSQLWYWGASYGTVLGSTFAALYPGRVGRMVLDGVVDGEDYYQAKWEANLPDADTAVRSFFQYCYDGGASQCEFWADSPSAIEARFNAVIDNLKDNPVIVANQSVVDYPIILTYQDFKYALAGVPYQPLITFPLMARVLVELEKGDGSTLAPLANRGVRPRPGQDGGDIEPMLFIACNDGNGRFGLPDFAAYEQQVNRLVAQSKWLGEIWSTDVSVNCRSLDVRPPASQQFNGPPSAKNTSTPLLFVSNKIDPVTPLRAAEKMSKLFGGSRLLTQDAVAHAAADSPSQCIESYVKKYFLDASLPPEGMICQPDAVPFQNGAGTNVKRAAMVKRRQAWKLH